MSDSIAPIGMKVVADLSDFGPKLKTGADDVASFASRSKQSLDNLSSSMSATGSQVSSFFSSFGQGAAGSAFSQTTSQVEGLISKISGGAGAFAAFGLAGVGAIGAIGAAALRTAGQINDLTKFSRTLGTSNLDTQALQEIFRRAGLDDEGARSSLLRFSGHIGAAAADENGAEAGAFHRIGLDPSALAGRGLANAFEQTITALSQIHNRFEQDAAASGIFGRRFADLESIIQRPDSFARARAAVGVGGVTDDVANMASGTRHYRHDTEDMIVASGGSVYQRLTQAWNSFSTLFDSASARFDRFQVSTYAGNLGEAAGSLGITPQSILGMFGASTTSRSMTDGERRPGIALDRYTPSDGPTAVQKAADKMLEAWQKEADLFTRSARASQMLRGASGSGIVGDGELRRTAELMRTQADGLDDARVRGLRAQNEINSAMERRAELERSLVSISDRTRTAYESFGTAMRSFADMSAEIEARHPRFAGEGFSPLHPEDDAALGILGRGRANAFLTLERSLGSGPSSYANGGIDPRTTAGANYLADLQVRGEVQGTSIEERIRLVLEGSQEVQRQQLEELRRINSGLDAVGPLIPAPFI